MDGLKITIVQSHLFWENKEKNLDILNQRLLDSIQEHTHLIVLPEMFTTGFSMDAQNLAEDMDGEGVKWMKHCAEHFSCSVVGSLMVKEEGKYYNRLVWMNPDGTFECYDKRHLFKMGDEHKIYTHGTKKTIVEIGGWRVLPVICYDLRFPVWLRNTKKDSYDVLLVVANWPEKRSLHWRTLIPARAVENQVFAVGVNRVGYDGNQVYHSGDTMVISPLGETLYNKRDEEDIYTITLSKEDLEKIRRQYPFLKDADKFSLK